MSLTHWGSSGGLRFCFVDDYFPCLINTLVAQAHALLDDRFGECSLFGSPLYVFKKVHTYVVVGASILFETTGRQGGGSILVQKKMTYLTEQLERGLLSEELLAGRDRVGLPLVVAAVWIWWRERKDVIAVHRIVCFVPASTIGVLLLYIHFCINPDDIVARDFLPTFSMLPRDTCHCLLRLECVV